MSAVLAASPEAGDARWRAIRAAAVDRYRRDPADRFGWRFARGKLRFDPVFRQLLADGLIPPGGAVLDLGCGQGLVGSLVAAAQDAARDGRWPAFWPPAPVGVRMLGIELSPREAGRARAALGADAVVCGDLCDLPFPAADTVVILDVLHYLAPAEQDRVLARVRDALPARGRLLLRVGDAGGRGFRFGAWVDGLVALCRRRRPVRQHGRSLAGWTDRLRTLGFEVQSRPMSRGTPFANVLIVARLAAGADR